jgi:surface carbohydrate biosynthesis protein (TIGR04326 family)
MKVIIWDSDEPPPQGEWTIVLWQSFKDDIIPNAVSIPCLIEKNANILKSRYLAWIYDMSQLQLQGLSIIDHLQIRSGFSYWWMTLLAEKCNYSKSPQITDAICFFMFTDWAAGRTCSSIVLISDNKLLAKCLCSWCDRLSIPFEWQPLLGHPSVYVSSRRQLFSVLPTPIQALVWLSHYLIERWSLRAVGLNEWRQTKGLVTFFSYFFNLEPNAARTGHYKSPYWGRLSDDLQGDGYRTNWLHLYVKDALLPNAKTAAKTVNSFNAVSQDVQNHVTLDTFLTLRIVLRAMLDWGRLAWTGWRIEQMISSSNQSSLDLWPLFADDWRQSTRGVTALHNVLNLGLLESAMTLLPKQKTGIYLQENQGWEFGLIHAWKTAGHGYLIGTPHSTVRFWDLRYFFDTRMYLYKGDKDLPLPDKVALNGSLAVNSYLAGGYPAKNIIEVEALRYMYLIDIKVRSHARDSSLNGGLRLIVLGDYLAINTQYQMELLAQSWQLLPAGIKIIVKPHPACPIYCEDYPSLSFKIASEPLEELLSQVDVAYVSSVTSAALDAYCAGIPVVTALCGSTLNQSPLRGCVGVFYVNRSSDLVRALTDVDSWSYKQVNTQEFFNLDKELPRWRRLFIDTC